MVLNMGATVAAFVSDNSHMDYRGSDNELIEDYDTFFTNLGLNTSFIAHIVVSKDHFLESCSQSAPADWTLKLLRHR